MTQKEKSHLISDSLVQLEMPHMDKSLGMVVVVVMIMMISTR
jgi:hypothetical protein